MGGFHCGLKFRDRSLKLCISGIACVAVAVGLVHGDQIAVIIKGTGIGREGAAFDGRAGGLRFAVHRVHGEHLEHDAALVYGDRLDEPSLTVVAVVGGGGDIVLALVGAESR